MIYGFKIDAQGYPTSTVAWAPNLLNDGGEVVGENPQPDGTVFPKDFDDILSNMTGPADDRKRYKFRKDGTYATEVDPSVAAWRVERSDKLRSQLEVA